MAFFDFLGNWIKGKDGEIISAKELKAEIDNLAYYELALHIVSERIATIFSNIEWQTYSRGKLKKDTNNWYMFNYEPNRNESGVEFKKKLAKKLVYDRQCLVIERSGRLYIADDYETNLLSNNTFNEITFNNVVVDFFNGNSVTPEGTFSGEKAIYMQYQNPAVEALYMRLTDMYASLIENVRKAGSSKIKYALNVDTTAAAGLNIDYQKTIQQIVNEDFRALASDNNAILPLYNGFQLEPLNQGNNNAQMASIANKSVNEQFEKVLRYVAYAYNVPYGILTGEEQERDYDNLMTFCIDPIVAIVETAFNRRFYGQAAIKNGTKLWINTRNSKHFEILRAGASFSQLISSGVMTINDIRTLLELETIDPEIGDKHWITRNYAEVGSFVQEAEEVRAREASGENVSSTGGGLK